MQRWLVVLVCLAAGCGNKGGNDNGGGPNGPMLKPTIGLDLTHIVGFAIAGGTSAARPTPGAVPEVSDGGATTTTTQLYAIDDQGNLVVTTIATTTDGDGGTSMTTTSMSEVPTGIVDTPAWVVFEMGNFYIDGASDMGQQHCINVLMRKSDGALFCDVQADAAGFPGTGAHAFDYDSGSDLFVADAVGLRRIDVTGAAPQSTTIFDVVQNGQVVEQFQADSDADALVSFRGLNAGSTSGLRVIKKNGGLQNLSTMQSVCQWRLANGAHDDWYWIDNSGLVRAVRQADGTFVTSNLTTTPGAPATCKILMPSATSAWGIVVHSGGVFAPGLVDMFDIGTTHPVAGITNVSDAVASSSAIFVEGTDSVGNGSIVRVDMPSMAATTILPAGAFSVTAISVSKTGELSFAGLRNADGARIIGNVPAGSDTYTIVSAAAPMVTALQRIN